jgi:hypothetical protein
VVIVFGVSTYRSVAFLIGHTCLTRSTPRSTCRELCPSNNRSAPFLDLSDSMHQAHLQILFLVRSIHLRQVANSCRDVLLFCRPLNRSAASLVLFDLVLTAFLPLVSYCQFINKIVQVASPFWKISSRSLFAFYSQVIARSLTISSRLTGGIVWWAFDVLRIQAMLRARLGYQSFSITQCPFAEPLW